MTILEMEIHPFMEFQTTDNVASIPEQQGREHQATFKDKTGTRYLMQLINSQVETRMNLKQLEQDCGLDKFNPYLAFENTLNQGPETVYFYSVMKNRLDTQVKRGAIVKALAIGSKRKEMLEPLTGYLDSLLDQVFD